MNNYKQSVSLQNLVRLIQDHKIFLDRLSPQIIEAVKKLGAYRELIATEFVWVMNYGDKDELVKSLQELNELGFLFAGGGAGWTAADVFGDLIEKQGVNINFKEVRWRGPSDCFIIER